MSKQVHYHQHGKKPLVLHVVKDHKNGLFDLARDADGDAIITDIAISEEIGDGKATPVELAKLGKKGGKKAAAEKIVEDGKDEEDDKNPVPPAASGATPPPDE